MTRFLLPLCALAFSCGPSAPSSTTLTLPSASSTPTTSPNATSTHLGPCTGAHGSSCAGGKGMCTSGLNTDAKECLLVADASGTCPKGAFAAKASAQTSVCLDFCSTVRDCGAGFFCNPTVLEDNRGRSQDVTVCVPGKLNRAGWSCDRQPDCELGTTDLTCVDATDSSHGICTKSCNTSADCQGGGNTTAVCAKNSAGKGLCFQGCTSDSFCPGGVCRNNICLPKSAASTSYPTPAAGAIGGACTSHAACGTGRFCTTSQPGGMCSASCTSDSQCGANSVCVDLTGRGGNAFCHAKCGTPGTQSNCRSGYSCTGLSGQSFGFCL